MERGRRGPWLIALIGLVLATGASFTWVEPFTVTLPRHTHPAMPKATYLGPADKALVMDLVVGLELRNRPQLEAILAAQQDSSSPWFHRWLTPEEFAAWFAPSEEAYHQVIGWLEANDLTVTQPWPNRLIVNAQGTVARVEAALGISINRYSHKGRLAHANAQDPQIPASLSGVIISIIGLEDLSQFHPHLTSRPHLAPNLKIGGTTLFGPKDLRTAYNVNLLLNAGLTGSGQKIAIATAFTFRQADINTFYSLSGLPPNPSTHFQRYFPTGTTFQFGDETTLDVEYTSAMAPGATIQAVIGKNAYLSTFTTVYNYIATQLPSTHVVSTSWGLCESLMPAAVMTTNNNIFMQAAAKGQSWFAASGDGGADDCGNGGATPEVDFPASSPYITGVGGTVLNAVFDTTGNATGYGSEAAWSGSGGGASVVFPKPSWQTNTPADGRRDVPDVALEAAPNPGNLLVFNGQLYRAWGTSFAAPQWAGIFAILNQKKGGTGLGNANPRLYELGALGANANGFHDVTSGSNSAGSTVGFTAASGYDQVTGWGSYNANTLVLGY